MELLDTAMIDLFNLRTGASFRKNKIKLNSFSTFEHGRKLEFACKENGLDATKHLLASVLAEMEIKEGFQGISEAGKCVSF
nr:conserved hypothetical protein [Xanthomonas citri pv. citri]